MSILFVYHDNTNIPSSIFYIIFPDVKNLLNFPNLFGFFPFLLLNSKKKHTSIVLLSLVHQTFQWTHQRYFLADLDKAIARSSVYFFSMMPKINWNRTCTVISYCSKQNRHKLNTNSCYGINIYFFLICSLLDVLEVVAPFKQFQKLRDFMTSKLPEGFPVQIGQYKSESCLCLLE